MCFPRFSFFVFTRNNTPYDMFIKAVKTKSNVQLKSSERKKLQQKVSTKFNVSPDDLNVLFPNKSSISLIKLITHSEDIVSVYAIDKRPLFFETPDQVFLPTVYTLWLVPNLLPAFTTHPAVSETFTHTQRQFRFYLWFFPSLFGNRFCRG